MSFIYLASPYSHPDPAVRHRRFETVAEAAAHWIKQGKAIYSPITHNHYIAVEFDLPREFDFWMNYDLAILAKASELWALKIPGHSTSKGMAAEMDFASKCKIPVHFVNCPFPIEDLDLG